MSFKDSSADSEDLITEINVTPFVDVVLVLLILFMLAAPAVYQSAVKIELPAVAAANKIKHVTLQFYLCANGDLMLDRERLQADQVQTIVKRALQLDPSADAMISADQRLSHGRVVEVLEAIQKGGIHAVALGVEVKSKGKNST